MGRTHRTRSAFFSTHAMVALLLGLAGVITAPAPAVALPCSDFPDPASCLSDPTRYSIKFNISTPGVQVTHIVDFWARGAQFWLSGQGAFPLDPTADPSKPSLPLGGGVLDAGYWYDEDEHVLLGLTNSGGTDHLVVIMSPAAAALMTGHPFDDMINGIPPLPAPPAYPQTGAELTIIDRLQKRSVEWNDDIGFLLDPVYFPDGVDPRVTINGSSVSPTFSVMQFSTGTLIGSASAQITPVPEPATWLTLIAGIGMLGLLRARRAGSAIAG